jgi:hypothetical protein
MAGTAVDEAVARDSEDARMIRNLLDEKSIWRVAAPAGAATATRKIELYSELLLDHGYPPLPDHQEPLVGPRSRLDLAERFPLILTCAKSTQFCE